jgi:hypothetical protein
MKNKFLSGVIICFLFFCSFVSADSNEALLSPGEIKYSGSVKLEYCDNFTMSFILSSDKTKIKNVTIKIDKLDYRDYQIQYRGSTETSYSREYEVKNGTADIKFADGLGHLMVNGLGGEEAAGEIEFVYDIQIWNNQMYRYDSYKVDMGKSPIVFRLE